MERVACGDVTHINAQIQLLCMHSALQQRLMGSLS